MDYTLTDHALKRIRRRKIKPEWVAETIEHPATTENDENDPTLVHALRPIAEKGFRVLRVIYNETTDSANIVTCFFDDEIKDL